MTTFGLFNVSAKEFTEFVRLQNEGDIEDDDAVEVAGGAFVGGTPALRPPIEAEGVV